LVNTAQLRLKKALAGELTGVSIELLKLKLEEIKKDTIHRRALQAAQKLPTKERDIFLAQLKSSRECLVTNYMSAEINLWLTIQSESGSKQRRAKKGVTLILSTEDHVKRGSVVPKIVEEANARGWIAGDIVLIK
jgi:mannitol-1-phosphate/altronate dehydrogenase